MLKLNIIFTNTCLTFNFDLLSPVFFRIDLLNFIKLLKNIIRRAGMVNFSFSML